MYILGALLLILVLWVLVSPSWAPAPTRLRNVGARAEGASKSAATRGQQVYEGIRGRLKFRNDKKDLAQRFRQWATEAGAARGRLATGIPGWADGFAAWLNGLSDKEAVEFSQDVARFCANQNFNIAWLNDPQINADPLLKQAVEEAVLLYGVAAWRADQVQGDVQGLLKLKAFLAKPNTRDNKAFGQALFNALASSNLVGIPAALMTAAEKERLDYMKRTIEQVSQRYPDDFSQVLRRVAMEGSGQTKSEPAPTATQVAAPVGGD
ncbi:MAG: hypothetical protein KIT87_04720 [Anaerolineae bacterium]|nr:hypothetical protein [Anaerolineae bacterium]